MKTFRNQLMKAGAVIALVGGMTMSARATLLVHYTFDEASSGTQTALNSGSVGVSANGNFYNTATRTGNTPANFSPGALSLPDNYALVGVGTDLSALDTLPALTVSMWVNVQGDRSLPFYTLASDLDAGGAIGWQMFYYPVDGDATKMNVSFQLNGSFHSAGTSLDAGNTWVFLAATWDGSTVTYYAGTPNTAVAPVGSPIALAGPMATSGSQRLYVGTDPSTSRTPNAFLDDFRLYNTVLNGAALDEVRLENLVGVPEPSVVLLLGWGGLFVWRRRKKMR